MSTVLEPRVDRRSGRKEGLLHDGLGRETSISTKRVLERLLESRAAGSNPASFAAGHQQFNASVPQGPSFSLKPGTAHLFEVWGSKGRVERDRFTL